jgi:hypothetical protein
MYDAETKIAYLIWTGKTLGKRELEKPTRRKKNILRNLRRNVARVITDGITSGSCRMTVSDISDLDLF